MAFVKRILRRFQRQTLVYWQVADSNPQGQPTYSAPVQLPCRWENKTKELVLPGGRKVNSSGYVLMGQSLTPGSLIFLGTLADVAKITTYPEQPLTNNQGAREVLIVHDTPDLNAEEHLYEVYF